MSRQSILWETCLDTKKDRQSIEQLHSDHTKKKRVDHLPTKPASQTVLVKGFNRFEIYDLDPKDRILIWLAGALLARGWEYSVHSWRKGRK
jgi:hypothetical protein